MFNILQWNSQGISTWKEDLLTIISEQQPGVLENHWLIAEVLVKRLKQ